MAIQEIQLIKNKVGSANNNFIYKKAIVVDRIAPQYVSNQQSSASGSIKKRIEAGINITNEWLSSLWLDKDGRKTLFDFTPIRKDSNVKQSDPQIENFNKEIQGFSDLLTEVSSVRKELSKFLPLASFLDANEKLLNYYQEGFTKYYLKQTYNGLDGQLFSLTDKKGCVSATACYTEDGEYSFIHKVGCKNSAKGKGNGKTIVQSVIDHAKSNKDQKILFLTTSTILKKAYKLYRALGFVELPIQDVRKAIKSDVNKFQFNGLVIDLTNSSVVSQTLNSNIDVLMALPLNDQDKN